MTIFILAFIRCISAALLIKLINFHYYLYKNKLSTYDYIMKIRKKEILKKLNVIIFFKIFVDFLENKLQSTKSYSQRIEVFIGGRIAPQY